MISKVKNTSQLHVLILNMENMMNRLFSHISSDEHTLHQKKKMNSPQINDQTKAKITETNIQLNMRQPYVQHVKRNFKTT